MARTARSPSRVGEKQYWKCQGEIKIYSDGKVLYTKTFSSKKNLKELMNQYKKMEIGIVFREQDRVIGKKPLQVPSE
jgi:hypothetical protein